MKEVSKRTRLAIELVSQAFVLDLFGGAGLDADRSKKLSKLLRDAAHTLDAKVKGPQTT